MKRVLLVGMMGLVACGAGTVGPSPKKDAGLEDGGAKDANKSGAEDGKQEDKVVLAEPDESPVKEAQELFQDAGSDECECESCVGDAQAETEVADVQEASATYDACGDLNDASGEVGLPEVVLPCTQIPCECTDEDAVFQGDCEANGIAHEYRLIGCKDGEPDYVFVDCDFSPDKPCSPCTNEGYWDRLYPCMDVGPWAEPPPTPELAPNPCASGPPFPRIIIALDENVKGCVLGCCSLKDHLPKWNLPIDPKTGACVEDTEAQ